MILSIVDRLQDVAMRRKFALLQTVLFQLLMAAVIAVALPATSAFADKKVALVVGNDRYTNLPPQRQLQKAVNDAEAVGDRLAKLGFTVVRGKNLDRQGFIDRLATFTAQLEAGDTAVFFFAGHGVAIDGVNYLLPSDVPADSESRVRGNSISEGIIVSEIQARNARVALLVLDACRDNPFPRSGTRSLGNTRGLADAKPVRGVFTIYSAGIGQSALDRLEKNDSDKNSVFTRVFIQQLGRTDLHLSDLAVEVREKVAELALRAKDDDGRPDPHEQTPAYYDQTIGGRIYLAGRSVAAESPANAKQDDVAVLQERLKQLQDELKKRDDAKATPPALPGQEPSRIKTVVVTSPAKSSTPPPDAKPAIGVVSSVPRRAVLYDEDPTAPQGKQYVGTVVWRTESVRTKKGPEDLAVRADIDIPERKLKMTLSLRYNSDTSLPASHTIETTFAVPPNFEGGGIANVPGVLMKSNEQARGTPLAGLAVKVTDGFFLVGLSNVETDRVRNLQLMKERSWFDIPLVYANQRRGIIAIDKGDDGDRAFKDVFAAWKQ